MANDGHYFIAFSSIGNSIPQGDPYSSSQRPPPQETSSYRETVTHRETTSHRETATLDRTDNRQYHQRSNTPPASTSSASSHYRATPTHRETTSHRDTTSHIETATLGRTDNLSSSRQYQQRSNTPPASTSSSSQYYSRVTPEQFHSSGHYPASYQTYAGHSSHQNSSQHYYPDVQPFQGHHITYNSGPTQIAESISPLSPGQLYMVSNQHQQYLTKHPTQFRNGLDHNANHSKVHYASDYSSNRVDYPPEVIPQPVHQGGRTPRLGEYAERVTPQSHHTQKVQNLTLFRTTIPISADDPPSSAPKMEQVVTETKDKTDGQSSSDIMQQAAPVIPEEDPDYETVIVTNNQVTSAVVHNADVQNDKEDDKKQDTDIVVLNEPEPDSPTTKIVETESQYAKPEVIKQRKSQLLAESTQIVTQAKDDDDDEGEVYSEVTKPRSSKVIVESQQVPYQNLEENPYEAPPVPVKTENAYLPQDENADSDTGSKGSVSDVIKKKADKIRRSDNYYASVEVSETDKKMVITSNAKGPDDPEDDYATVDIPGGAQASKETNSNAKIEDDPNYASVGAEASADLPAVRPKPLSQVITDEDFDDYATVGDGTPNEDIEEEQTPKHENGILSDGFFTNQAPVPPKKTVPEARTPSPLAGPSSKSLDFQLPKGYSIGRIFNLYLHEGDITKMRVDAIVNPANSKLKFGDGVSGAIAKAAGKDFEKDCKKALKKVKQIEVSHAVVTDAGKLPCKKVIHAVGPKWTEYKDKAQCQILLLETFRNILKACSAQNVNSVTIPPISSGSFGVPNDKVMSNLHQAMLDVVDDLATHKPPGHVHIVDKEPNILCSLIEQMNGGNVTSRGSNVIVDELSREAVEHEVGSILAGDAKKNKKVQKLPSMNKGRGKTSSTSTVVEDGGYIDKFGRKHTETTKL